MNNWGMGTHIPEMILVFDFIDRVFIFKCNCLGLAYQPSFKEIIKLIVYMVLVDFYLTGIVISTVTWILVNRLFNPGVQFSSYNINYISWGSVLIFIAIHFNNLVFAICGAIHTITCDPN